MQRRLSNAVSAVISGFATKNDEPSTRAHEDEEEETTEPIPIPSRRPSLPRLPSEAIESDSSGTSGSPPQISFSPDMSTTPTFSRASTFETDEGSDLSGAATPQHHLATPSMTSSSSASSSSPSTIEGYRRHRRSWSQHMPKDVKQTLDAKSSEDPENGARTLNQYRLGEELGKGSFGYVWRAIDTTTGQQYAIKELSKSRLRRQAQAASMRANRKRAPRSPRQPSIDHEDGLRLIEHEVAIMKKLKHINILSLREVLDDQDNDSIYMVLELCQGGPIMQITVHDEVPALEEATARSYFRQVLLALEYLHHLSICHHDIKPDNILICGTPGSSDADLVKLCDFGVSQLFAKEADDLSSKNVGSPAFLSPEMNITSHGQLHQRASDVWALGVTLYCLLVGRLPFRSTNSLELGEMIKSEPAAIPRTLSPEARDILSRMLDKDPESRAGINELREHAWTTENGTSALPTSEDNCSSIEEPTKEDVESALKSLSGAATAVRLAIKLRRMATARRSISTEGTVVPKNDDAVGQMHKTSSSASYHDDTNVELLRYVENETNQEVLARSQEIVRARSGSTSGGSGGAASSGQ